MFGLDKTTRRFALGSVALFAVAIAGVLVFGVLVGSGASSARSVPRPPESKGPWRVLSRAPFSIDAGLTSVWTGKEMIVSGLSGAAPDGTLVDAVDLAAAYDPTTDTWRRLASPPTTESYCRRSAVWTGSEMLVWGCAQLAFNPQTNTWRRLPQAPTRQGIVVWTGKEMIGWGGGCCGDADSGGSAYNPATNTWRTLAASPLAPSQSPAGAWTGRELILFVSGLDTEGKPVAGAARAAAYDPETDTWRRIAPAPAPIRPTTAVSDDDALIVFGAEGSGITALIYRPTTNRWQRLGAIAPNRGPGFALSTGRQIVFANGALDTIAYYSSKDHWQPMPRPPLTRHSSPAAVWTGDEVILWDGRRGDGAAIKPPKHAPPPLPQCCGGG